MEDVIYDILLNKDEITWQTIIFELIKTNELDPRDVNISLLSKKYVELLKTMKELNLRVSGKVLLAAALLLRIKSTKLIGEDIAEFDRLISMNEEDDEDLYGLDEDDQQVSQRVSAKELSDKYRLIPRTPQPRKRKVSVHDLIDALDKALGTQKRRVLSRMKSSRVEIPENVFDIDAVMDTIFDRIIGYFDQENTTLRFTDLIPSESKEDKVYTFIPLLHLSNARKVDLDQTQHFGEINIALAKKED